MTQPVGNSPVTNNDQQLEMMPAIDVSQFNPKKTHKREPVGKRQIRIAQTKMLNPAMTNIEMAKKFNVCVATIENDYRALRLEGQDWGDRYAQGEFMFLCQVNVARMELVIQGWEQKIRAGDASDALKGKFLDAVALQTELIDNVPMYHKWSYYAKMIEEGKVNV